MTLEVHIAWKGESLFVGKLHSSERTPSSSFEYSAEWLARSDAFPLIRLHSPSGPAPIMHRSFLASFHTPNQTNQEHETKVNIYMKQK